MRKIFHLIFLSVSTDPDAATFTDNTFRLITEDSRETFTTTRPPGVCTDPVNEQEEI